MNEGRERDDVVGSEAFAEDAGVAPIDVVDDTPAVPPAVMTLAELVLAGAEKDAIKSDDVDKVFAAVQRLRKPDAGPDGLNDLGCAWAILAYRERELSYWPAAIEALNKAAAHKGASADQKSRAAANLERVEKARQEQAEEWQF